MRRLIRGSLAAAGLFIMAPAALAHDDVLPAVRNGQIVTHGWDDGLGAFTPGVRVYGYDFGEDPFDPFVIGDPGVNNEASFLSGDPGDKPAPATYLPVNAPLSFNLQVVGITGNVSDSLRYWDGTGPVGFGPAPAGVTLELFKPLADSAVAGNGTGPVSGFIIDTADADGALHIHLNSLLHGADGNTFPSGPGPWGAGDGDEAPAGVYLIQLILSAPGVDDSLPFWIVYNNGVDEEIHDAAIDFVIGELVNIPEPASASLLALGAAAMLARRRRA